MLRTVPTRSPHKQPHSPDLRTLAQQLRDFIDSWCPYNAEAAERASWETLPSGKIRIRENQPQKSSEVTDIVRLNILHDHLSSLIGVGPTLAVLADMVKEAGEGLDSAMLWGGSDSWATLMKLLKTVSHNYSLGE